MCVESLEGIPAYFKEVSPNSEMVFSCDYAEAHKARQISELRAELNSIKAMLI